MGGEGRQTEIGREGVHTVLRRPHPLTAELDDVLRTVADRMGQDAPANPVAGLQHPDVEAPARQVASGREPGQAGTDDHHVAVMSHQVASR